MRIHGVLSNEREAHAVPFGNDGNRSAAPAAPLIITSETNSAVRRMLCPLIAGMRPRTALVRKEGTCWGWATAEVRAPGLGALAPRIAARDHGAGDRLTD